MAADAGESKSESLDQLISGWNQRYTDGSIADTLRRDSSSASRNLFSSFRF
jgi:hypothetical protein